MSTITEIVRNLLLIIIIASFLEAILPDGNIKPLVRFAIGLFILIAILNPALDFVSNAQDFKIAAWNQPADERIVEEIENGRQEIEKQIAAQSNAVIKEKMEGQISAVAVLVPGVDDVHSKITLGKDGMPQKLVLTVNTGAKKNIDPVDQVNVFSETAPEVDAEEQAQIQKKIRQVMNNLYGLEVDNIEINFEGG